MKPRLFELKLLEIHLNRKRTLRHQPTPPLQRNRIRICTSSHERSSSPIQPKENDRLNYVRLSLPNKICPFKTRTSRPSNSTMQALYSSYHKTKTKTIGPRSFATSGPALWNKLPDDLRDPSLSLPVFKQRLKSYLFKQC